MSAQPGSMGARLRTTAALVRALDDRPAAALAFAAGAAAALAFAPFYLVPLLCISFPVLILLIDRARDRQAALASGWWFGFGYFLVGLYWVGNSFLAQDDVPKWGGIVAALALAMALALFVAVAGWLAKSLWLDGWRRVPLFAAAFAMAEWLRGHLFTGFPWNLQANVWGWSDSMIQSVSLLGSYGLGVLTVLAAASLVVFADSPKERSARFPAWGLPALSLGLLGALFIFGAVRLSGLENVFHPDVRLRIVQANIPQIEKWQRDKWRDNFVRHIGLSLEGDGGLDGITHVIWPETAVPYFIGSEPSRRHLVARALGNRPVLITGAPRLEEGEDRVAYYNAVHAIGAKAQLLATYDKAHLVPFGEYLPFRGLLNWLGLEKLTPGAVDFSAGPGLRVISLPGLPPFGPLVCYEVIFPGQVVADGGGADETRPEWLLNLTNDAWFGDSPGPYQHLVMSRFRAAEEGLPVIRAAGTGISAIIDPYGRLLGSIGLNEQGVMDSGLPRPSDGSTFYATMGDLPFALLVLLCLAARLPLSGGGVRRQ